MNGMIDDMILSKWQWTYRYEYIVRFDWFI